MELNNEFRVGVPVDQAWAVLTDVERIAPCMPGAELREVEGDEYRGVVKVRVGPISAEYRGAATFVEQDAEGHRAVLKADGRDTRGQGNANATITAVLEPDADGTGTNVKVLTDLSVTGRVAQFGRGVLADVSGKLLQQFVDCLETTVLAGADGAGPSGAGSSTDGAPAATAGDGEDKADGSGDDAPRTTAGEGADGSGGVTESTGAEAERLAGSPPSDPSPGASPSDATPEAPAGDPTPEAQAGYGGASTAGSTQSVGTEAGEGIRHIDGPSAQPVDLLEVAGTPILRRLAPVVGIVLGIGLLAWLIGRRNRH